MDLNGSNGRKPPFSNEGQSLSGETAVSPILRRHLHDELLNRLRDCIINGDLAPGAKVPEKELCERFGVSRTPLREALKVLAYEGLVVLHHNRGSTVSPLTLEDLEEAFPIYGKLEALAGELAATRLTDAEIADIRALHDKMIRQYEQRDLRGHFHTNEEIHERIQLGSRNQTLIHLLRNISSRIRRARIYANMSENRWMQAVEEHEKIITALESRDGALLSQLLHDHMQNTFVSTKNELSDHIMSDKTGFKKRPHYRLEMPGGL